MKEHSTPLMEDVAGMSVKFFLEVQKGVLLLRRPAGEEAENKTRCSVVTFIVNATQNGGTFLSLCPKKT